MKNDHIFRVDFKTIKLIDIYKTKYKINKANIPKTIMILKKRSHSLYFSEGKVISFRIYYNKQNVIFVFLFNFL